MPEGYLRPLALIAVFLAAYSFYCRFFLKTHFRLALLLLSSANFLYCLMTSALVFVTFDRLTKLGVAYFIAEALLILALVAVEFKTALQSKS